MADMVFILDFLHCLPKYLVCIFSNFKTYNCIMACFTFSVLFKIGADLKTTSIWKIKLQFTMLENFSKKSRIFQRCERSELHLFVYIFVTSVSCLFMLKLAAVIFVYIIMFSYLFTFVIIISCLFTFRLPLSAICLPLNYQYQLFVYIFAKL